MLRGLVAWVCRGSLAVALLAASVSGAQASVATAQPCGALWCSRAGTIRWQELLPGSYVIHDDARGTMPSAGEPYAAIGRHLAVFGLGTSVTAYDAQRGTPRWSVQLKNVPLGAQIVSARVWPGVITVGAAAAAGADAGRAVQTEVVFDAATGRVIRSYPGIPFGGTVAADPQHTVIVGPGAVTSYDNRTGRVMWRRPTGAAPQRWQLDGRYLYVTVASSGYLGPAPVTALRRIDLRSGTQRILRPPATAFAGTLAAALGGVVLFGDASGVTAYSGNTGRWLWHLSGVVPQGTDFAQERFYLSAGSALIGVDPRGAVQSRLPGASGLYGERRGVAFGLDEGANGEAWGLDAASKQVVWSSSALPWPHVFIDLSGLGGGADPRSDAIILAACGQPDLSVTPPQCTKPELVVVNR